METSDLLHRVRKIEIKTRRLSKNVFAGEYHSAFKGRGMAFSEVRGYQYGDDIRNIDWNVTARFNQPYIKVFEEERELTVMILVDVSGSKFFGTQTRLKKDFITEIAAVLSFSAIQNNDKIGIIFFSGTIEKFIPPQKGKKHILRIIREMLDFEAQDKTTDIAGALQYFTNAIKKRCTAFLISDFIDEGYENAMRIANYKHDLTALKIYDLRESELPPLGLVRLRDPETGITQWIDTSSRKVRNEFGRWWQQKNNEQRRIFQRCGVDFATIRTDEDYVKPLIQLFKRR